MYNAMTAVAESLAVGLVDVVRKTICFLVEFQEIFHVIFSQFNECGNKKEIIEVAASPVQDADISTWPRQVPSEKVPRYTGSPARPVAHSSAETGSVSPSKDIR